MVGGKATCPVKDVEKKMRSLLGSYFAKEVIAFEDIVSFHAEFEAIHPFQDGNGRVGRLIMVKECLKYGVTPFLIEDSKKAFYYRGLSNWSQDKALLIETCLGAQNSFKALLKELGISESSYPPSNKRLLEQRRNSNLR